jgi:RNA-directed DNA polymerase
MIIDRIAADLGLTTSFINTFARGASHAYKTYVIRKRGGGEREIHHPSKQLKALQRWFLQYVLSALPVHPAAMAYIKHRSIFDNATIHADSRYLLRMDFENFLPSITETDLRVYIDNHRTSLFAAWTNSDNRRILHDRPEALTAHHWISDFTFAYQRDLLPNGFGAIGHVRAA